MNKVELIQNIIREKKFRLYLEIGTHKGSSLLPIRCRNKLAVDPEFLLPKIEMIKWYLFNFSNFRNRYFNETSDDFFAKRKALLDRIGPVDVVFIDGLHTFEQSLVDVFNSLKYLNPSGFIIMHDCHPPDEYAAYPAPSISNARSDLKDKWTGQWCGDVWKTIFYLRQQYSDLLDICVIDTDYGLGVIRLKTREKLELTISPEISRQIKGFDYSVIASDPSKINLKSSDFALKLAKDPGLNFD